VRPQWRRTSRRGVKRFTGGSQIRHFVMAITKCRFWMWEVNQLTVAARGLRQSGPHKRNDRPFAV
jgi:hypothetical protein